MFFRIVIKVDVEFVIIWNKSGTLIKKMFHSIMMEKCKLTYHKHLTYTQLHNTHIWATDFFSNIYTFYHFTSKKNETHNIYIQFLPLLFFLYSFTKIVYQKVYPYAPHTIPFKKITYKYVLVDIYDYSYINLTIYWLLENINCQYIIHFF